MLSRAPRALRWLPVMLLVPTGAHPSTVSVKLLNGRPALFTNAHPLVPNMFFNTSWKVEVVSDSLARGMARAGVRLHQFDVNLDWSADYATKNLAIRNGAYRSTDSRLLAVLHVDPTALFLLRVHLQPPHSWGESHPDDLLTAEDGTRIDTGSRWSAAVSYASDLWRQDAGARLATFIRHLQESGLQEHILGFLLFAGRTGEWNWWVPPRDGLSGKRFARLANMCTDHSPAMTRAFRRWVAAKYDGRIETVRRAWGVKMRDLGSFAEVRVPTEEQVGDALNHQLNAGPAACRAADYFACNSAQVADSLLSFARVAKETAPGRLCGAFFGEFLFAAIGGNREWLRTGHLEFDRVIRSPFIDFLCTPQAYQSRALGESAPSMTLVDSAALHGKFVFSEFDQPTHLALRENPSARDAPTDPAGTRAVLRRAFAYALCRGLGIWWWDQAGRNGTCGPGGTWYRDPQIIAEFGRFQHVWSEALNRPCGSVSEVAVLVDLRSPLWQRCSWRDLTFDLVYEQLDALGTFGAPFDLYSLGDLAELPDYKLYVVLNAFRLNEQQRGLLHRRLDGPRVSVLWFFAPGALSPGESVAGAAARMAKLTGLPLRRLPAACALTANPTAVLPGNCPRTFGTARTIEPSFADDETGVKVLARYTTNSLPAVVLKAKPGGVVAWSAIAPLPAEVLRFLARAAGCHLYSVSGDVVFACRSYVGLHTATPGKHELVLPKPASVYTLFPERSLGQPLDRIRFTTAQPTTRLFRVVPPLSVR